MGYPGGKVLQDSIEKFVVFSMFALPLLVDSERYEVEVVVCVGFGQESPELRGNEVSNLFGYEIIDCCSEKHHERGEGSVHLEP